ncbi:MAG TPA: response regulator [Sphingobacteriaceae bacterium]
MSLVTIIIDDDQLTCKIHEKLLRYADIAADPKVFLNALEALDFLHSDQDIVDDYLIFLDINMPVMSGWSFLDELKKLSIRNYHVVIISSSVQPSDQERARWYPNVIRYVVKPIDKLSLKEVKAFMDEKYPAGRILNQD